MSAWLPVVVLLFSSIGWGLTWLPLAYLGNAGVAGPPLILVAFGAAALGLLPVLVIQSDRWRGQLRYLVLIAVFGGYANMAFQSSLYHGEVIRVMILFYLLPVWGVLGGRLFLGERIDAVRVAAVIGALGGAYLLLGGPGLFDQLPSWVDLLAVSSGFAFAMNNLVFRYAQQIPVGSKVSAMFLGVVAFIALYMLAENRVPVDIAPANLVLTMLYGICWVTLITFGTQWGVTRLEAGRASILIVMELVAAVISSVWLLNQSLSRMEVTGIVLVVAAALAEGARAGKSV
jgi:drug/metabolite transporter (DMT)-like permease